MGKQEQIQRDAHISGQSNEPLSKPAHALCFQTVIEETGANPQDGLTSAEAKRRLERFGRNELGDTGSVQPVRILLRQFANAMTLILIMAMAVSFGIKAWIEGGVLAAVLFINIGVGFVQEFQAQKTMDSLRSLSSPTANAVRNGLTVSIPTAEVVPGDMIEMKAGETIPADVRLIETINFDTDEALLTGESLPVRKDASAIFDEDTGPGDRLNVAYSSSTVTKGRARGIVFATGVYTEIGSIAAALRAKGSRRRRVKREPDGTAKPHRYAEAWILTISDAVGKFLGVNEGTPLQRKLSWLAIILFGTAILCAIIVLAANSFSNKQEVIIYAVATGLSMIPSSLVVVLTITMTVGTKRMVKRHVIVRNLNSLEALGAVTDICSDKTGTLTQGKMVAKKAWIPSHGTYSIGESSEPYNPTVGDVYLDRRQPREINFKTADTGPAKDYHELLEGNTSLEEYLKVASLANLAVVHQDSSNDWKARGDPTEIAIQVFASRFNRNRTQLTSSGKDGMQPAAWKLLAEFPFDSDVKQMSAIYQETVTEEAHVFTKGAVERIIDSCTSICLDDETEGPLNAELRGAILANMEALAALGLRVLALASRPFNGPSTDDSSQDMDRSMVESELIFRGLIGLYDPPRLESAQSVRQCHAAGIVVHMVTGDHPGTARAIAADVGIFPSAEETKYLNKDTADSMVMTAAQFDKMSDDQLDMLPVLPLVIARCAPSTKVRMIEALHRRRKFAAMTGDGVNDSPSLKRADVGIAMGQSGSDVAKDASDIVLSDDNFASILNAVEEGRRMFDNVQKFILHVLSQNLAQALILLVGLVFKDNSPEKLSVFPLSPVEIVWLVMITSGLPDMGLGFEQAAEGIMVKKPRSLKRGVFTPEIMLDMLVYGIWVAALCLGAFSLVIYGFGNGSIGTNCNNTYSASCDLVFRARATTYACLTWFVLFLAWEMVDMRRSFFHMRPPTDGSRWVPQWCRDVWKNQFLFWANISGFVMVFPILYLPVINEEVFRHTGISWEWGIVFVGTILFFAGVELWKWVKRAYFRRTSYYET
ncbi:potassium/sodium efflux P-type ATPase [Lasiodiplodia theobromae]|nr:potassium/sodium efflux P-type ATPase [Lasiodiplodia theobromae]